MNLPASKPSIKKALFCAALAPLLLATQAVGAVISWQTPVNVDNNDSTQVLNNGTVFSIWHRSSPTPTLNGVSFVNTNVPTIPATLGGNSTLTPSPSTSYSSILTDLDALNDATAAGGASLLFSGLSIGQTYEFQIWAGYSWPPLGITANRFSDSAPSINGGGFTDGTYHASNESGNVAPANTGTAVSQFVVGTFVANATTQNLFYYGDGNYAGGGGLPYGEIAAYQLRAIDPVPEPQTWALAALGVSAVVFRLRRKQSIA